MTRRSALGGVLLAFALGACGSRTALDPGAAPHLQSVGDTGGASSIAGAMSGAGARSNGGVANVGGVAGGPVKGGAPTAGGVAGETSGGAVDAGSGGMPDDPLIITVTQLAVGSAHTCALLSDGSVRCFGSSSYGELGYGNMEDLGDDESLSSVPPVSITTASDVVVVELVAGESHTCALLSDGSVKCWGRNYSGQLGYGHTQNIGDDELPSSVGAVSVTSRPGLVAVALAAKFDHTCALLSDGSVTCWGGNRDGQLGYGNTLRIGDDELPSSAGPVSVTTTPGVTTVALSTGYGHTCALLSDNSVKCWGEAGGGLGYGNADDIGDDEPPSSVGAISLTNAPGVKVVGITSGNFHDCAWFSDGSARCWGYNVQGQLGYGNTEIIGDDETPSSVGPLAVTDKPGVAVVAMAGGAYHTCAVLSHGTVKCWGVNAEGDLGLPGLHIVGDDEPILPIPPVSVTTTRGLAAIRIAAGGYNTCVVLSNGSGKCWGGNDFGQLGYGNTENIGDNESPSSVGSLVFF